MNSLSSVIDASSVYGSDEATNKKLRMNVDGLLKVNTNYTDELLPMFNGSVTAGEMRLKESPTLTSLHTIFLRSAAFFKKHCLDQTCSFQTDVIKP